MYTIVVVPLLVEEILSSGGVVTSTKSSKVVVDSKQIVHKSLVLWESYLASEVETFHWEVNLVVNLVSEGPETTKSFQMNN